MILRYYTHCPGCNSSILLRLQVGIDENQPFFFVCQSCSAATKGSLQIDYKSDPPGAELNLNDGELLAEIIEKPDQTITLGLDLPCLVYTDEYKFDETSIKSLFPFIYQTALMGGPDKVQEFQQRISEFRGVINNDWPKVNRLITYYSAKNWRLFDREWERIFDNVWPKPTSEFERHDSFHKVIELIFVNIQPEFEFPLLKLELNSFISRVAKRNPSEFRKYLRYLTKTFGLARLQRSLLERLSFIANNFSALNPGFPILFYDKGNEQSLSDLRIMRDDFEILKGHFLGCFELSHKALVILVGLQNIYKRGDENLFPDGKPKSLAKFSKMPNAFKPNHINSTDFPELESRWSTYFDRDLRNAIGHQSVYHDLSTGLLILDNADPLPYSKFVANTLNLTPMIFYSIQLVKMMYIAQTLGVEKI